MLRNRNLVKEEICFFITTSCHKMLPLLKPESHKQIILENWKFYNKRYKAKLLAYVIMSNHIHFIIHFTHKNKLSEYMRDFKKYSATQIRNSLSEIDSEMLDLLVHPKNGAKHKIWEDRFDDVHLYSQKVCETKLEYIHLNPLKAGLVGFPEDYKYSSASFYMADKPVKSQLVHYMDVF